MAEIVWRKVTNSGKVCFGMGHTVHGAHETCIIAKRGFPKVQLKNVRSIFDAEVTEDLAFDAERGVHSQKPEKFFEIVEAMYKGPYVELFARRRRPGWVAVGNQL